MAGHTDPPDGTPPGGVPGGGDEEYRSTVFDESFIRAARLEEFSAEERLTDRTSPVRSRPEVSVADPRLAKGLSRQGLALALVVLLAFAAAIYLGSNATYGGNATAAAEPPHTRVVPLAPAGDVPGGDPAQLYADSPAAEYGIGAAGLRLPSPHSTENFTREQVLTALTVAKDYVVASALTPEVVSGATVHQVRDLLAFGQQQHFEDTLTAPEAERPVTGWFLRFDPSRVVLADPQIRADGGFTFEESTPAVLAVTAEHVVAYTVRPPGPADGPAALFTVRRQLRMNFSEEDLRDRRVTLRDTDVLAGPMSCDADPAHSLDPLLAGESASRSGPGETDLFDPEPGGVPLCGSLATGGLPSAGEGGGEGRS
ncbi:hypothetical protein GCM10009716_37210 [Streptomyces sodiiphilus]|uniref:Uncharacterized protein n=1 Tax=Streptomyces sodiiphilus TaxID=226217 RepID=A0ABN2PNX9_9ACTN